MTPQKIVIRLWSPPLLIPSLSPGVRGTFQLLVASLRSEERIQWNCLDLIRCKIVVDVRSNVPVYTRKKTIQQETI